MTLFTPLRPNPAAPLARANPVAKLVAAVILMGVLFVSVDPLTPAIVLAGLAACVPLTGIAVRDLLIRSRPILIAALAVGLLNISFAAEHAGTPIRVGAWTVGSENVLAGLALALRLAAIAMSGVLAIVTTDPTDLADSLVQQARVPPRFAIGALAAARLMPIMATEWQSLARGRRGRGVWGGG
jgi:energy-coupling factor transport system permease protein